MFGKAFFGSSFYGPFYWGKGSGVVPPAPTTTTPARRHGGPLTLIRAKKKQPDHIQAVEAPPNLTGLFIALLLTEL